MNFTILATSSLKAIKTEYNSLDDALTALRNGKHNDLIDTTHSTLADNENPSSFVISFDDDVIEIEIYDDYRE